ncbi:MAG TPA: chromosome segregation protein SMC [Humisphaera sp.]
MRLKKLILHGFKSFGDRTEFVFDAPITGIVGPNGCGKSNVVDGFKWVLGEQSAKSLRGEAMLDVIFNGSGGRKPANMAEVVLVFDNPKKEDGTRTLQLDLDEVAVGRRLYRDGTSEYTQNNSVARLKDIRELFMDTGVGVDAYSVIEQGRVAALLEANPEERRLIFEEAAGISKFKQRKKEAQRKLEKVDQNLVRVNDIVEEVEKRLRSVKVQAGKARNYQEYAVRLNELRLNYSLREYHVLHAQVTDLQQRQDDAKFRLDDAFADLSRSQNALAEKRESFDVLSRAKQQAEHQVIETRAGVQAAKQRQEWATQQARQLGEQQEQFEMDREAASERLAEAEALLESESANLAQLTADLAEKRNQIEEHQAAHADGQHRLNTASREIEQNKAAILDLMRRQAATNSRLGAIEIERKNIANQQGRLAERQSVIKTDLEAIAAQKADAQATLEETLAHIAEQQRLQEEKREQAKHLGKQIATITDNLGAAKEHRSGLLSRQKLLRDLESKREGVSEGVKAVLKQRGAGQPFEWVRGLVADVIRVDVEHATLIEAALDGRDQWLVTDRPDAAGLIAAVSDEFDGRVNVVCTREVPAHEVPAHDWNKHPHLVRLAADLVRYEPQDAALVDHLLGRTVAVDTLTEADALRRLAPAGWRYVTYGGEVVEGDGTVRAGPLTAAMGLISRRSELEVLEQQLVDVEARIASLTEELSHTNAAARALEEEQNALRNEVYRANTTKVELTGKVQQLTDRAAALNRELPLVERELANYESQVDRLAGEEEKLAETKAALEAEHARRQQAVEELTVQQRDVAEELKVLAETLTAARVEIGQIQQRQLATQQHVQRLTAQRAELTQQVERLARSAEGLVAKRAQVEEELEIARENEATLAERLGTLTAQAQELAKQAAEAGEAMRTYQSDVERYRSTHAEIEQSLHALEVSLGQSKVRLETLIGRTQEEMQVNIVERYEQLVREAENPPAEEPAAEAQPAEEEDDQPTGAMPSLYDDSPAEPEEAAPAKAAKPKLAFMDPDADWDEIAAEIKELKEKIHRLGNVNLDAIAEMDDLEQRSKFLTQQVTDLTESKRQLEELIEKINIESGLRFEQTFTAVREHFQGMFRKLFGGGKADLFLETEIEMKPQMGPDGQMLPPEKRKIDPLEAGIEVIAHPPGKKPATINQLSGGEKAMTCIALLMSIFKSKPSPFCILDEVDAPLDEANNQRFGLIIQEFLSISQFIVITHHKRTMQICDVLYGVTMQEQGVSKRVAVKFDQVDSQGRISETAAA